MAPPPSKKKPALKQGNLFSFFSKSIAAKGNNNNNNNNNKNKNKKPIPKAAASTAASSSNNNNNSTTQQASLPPRQPLMKKLKQKDKNTIWKKIKKGSRVAILWPDDKLYYPCTVETQHERINSRWFIRYDDNETEWTDLAQEKLRWCEDDEHFEEEEEEEQEETRTGASSASAASASASGSTSGGTKRNRRSIEESDDDEEEEQEWKDPGGDHEESDDEEGSVFDAAVDEEEEDEEGNWMVTDDEDDISRSATKKKKQQQQPKKVVNNPYKKKTAVKIIPHSTTSASASASATAVSAASVSASATTPPPFAKRMKSSNDAASNTGSDSAFKTPLKDFSHTISPRTASTSPKQQRHSNSNSTSKKNTTSMASLTSTPHTSSPKKNINNNPQQQQQLLRLNPHFLTMGDKPLPYNSEKGTLNVRGAHIHNHLQFLRYPRDAHGRYRDDVNYDPRTLLVVEQEWTKLDNMTPAVTQWWELKAQYFDTILLFKTGKFYEMYQMDADIGVEVLGFCYMKGKQAHAGFPEIRYGFFADKLVRAGYKVARVEQTETPEQLKIRKTHTPKSQKTPKVVNREVCSILTLGTRTFCPIDVDLDVCASYQNVVGGSDGPGPLLVIREKLIQEDDEINHQEKEDEEDDETDEQPAVCEYGITVINAMSGTVTVGWFADDVLRSRMQTLLVSFSPSEILLQGKPLQPGTTTNSNNDGEGTSMELVSLVKAYQNESRTPCQLEYINQNESFPKSTALNKEHARHLERRGGGGGGHGSSSIVRPWNWQETFQELHRRCYYPRASRRKKKLNTPTTSTDISRWPSVLQRIIEGNATLTLSSFGAALFYLQRNLIDREILSMNLVQAYVPIEKNTSTPTTTTAEHQTPTPTPPRGGGGGGGRGQSQSQSQSQSQQSQCDDDGDARMHSVNTNTNANITPTSTVDNFWTTQLSQQQTRNGATAAETGSTTNIVTQESAREGLEENPLYQIPTTVVAQPSQKMSSLMTTSGTASSIADTTSTPGSGVGALADHDNNNHNHNEEHIKFMSLDGTTLHNLEILTNAVDYKIVGSLWHKLNYTKSPHGARMLRAWLLRPLFQKAEIDRRADAVEELIRGAANLSLKDVRDTVLSKIGDLDRLIGRVHSMSVGVTTSDSGGGGGQPAYDDEADEDMEMTSNDYHPNERAVLYEGKTYTARKVKDFKSLLLGLQKACQIPELFADIDLDPKGYVYKLVRLGKDGGLFPDMVDSIDWFMDNFDCEEAAKGGFVPKPGIDPVYDEACETITQVKNDLENYQQEMCDTYLKPRHVAQRAWKYANIKPESKDKYLIELPVTVEVPTDFFVKGKRGAGQKRINKYSTPVVVELVKTLESAHEIQQSRKAKGMQIIFAKFNNQRPLWSLAASITGILDALGSLAIMAGTNQGYCRAEILECSSSTHSGQQPLVNIVQGRHPVIENTFTSVSSSEFIPNDLQLGQQQRPTNNNDAMNDNDDDNDNESARLLLLSGPNMGGKSTMLRQTCLIAILAQIGSYVPAESCQLTPIDCIFTRLGASDRILLGQSTFFVELAETAAALRGATRRSLVIMDELGRGTSTFDGTAIASATVKHLVERSQCLTLFATHYHSLLDEWKDVPNVRLGHMQCIVDADDDDDDNDNVQSGGGSSNNNNGNITFLYTLGPGSCPRSFGINVAKLAGLPEEVLVNAKLVSAEFEDEMNGGNGSGKGGTTRQPPKVSDEDAKEHLQHIRELIANENYEDVLRAWKNIKQQSYGVIEL